MGFIVTRLNRCLGVGCLVGIQNQKYFYLCTIGAFGYCEPVMVKPVMVREVISDFSLNGQSTMWACKLAEHCKWTGFVRDSGAYEVPICRAVSTFSLSDSEVIRVPVCADWAG
jgi:hypothetical protein